MAAAAAAGNLEFISWRGPGGERGGGGATGRGEWGVTRRADREAAGGDGRLHHRRAERAAVGGTGRKGAALPR